MVKEVLTNPSQYVTSEESHRQLDSSGSTPDPSTGSGEPGNLDGNLCLVSRTMLHMSNLLTGSGLDYRSAKWDLLGYGIFALQYEVKVE